jgi:hypothetical protein
VFGQPPTLGGVTFHPGAFGAAAGNFANAPPTNLSGQTSGYGSGLFSAAIAAQSGLANQSSSFGGGSSSFGSSLGANTSAPSQPLRFGSGLFTNAIASNTGLANAAANNNNAGNTFGSMTTSMTGGFGQQPAFGSSSSSSNAPSTTSTTSGHVFGQPTVLGGGISNINVSDASKALSTFVAFTKQAGGFTSFSALANTGNSTFGQSASNQGNTQDDPFKVTPFGAKSDKFQ